MPKEPQKSMTVDQFFEALSRTGNGWVLVHGRIRQRRRSGGRAVAHTPLTAVCEIVSDRRHNIEFSWAAGRELGLSEDDYLRISLASEGKNLDIEAHAQLRQRLLQALKLEEVGS